MIEKEDIEQLRLVFVTREECQNTTDGLQKQIGSGNVRMAVIETELRQIKWLLGTVLAASLGTLVSSVLSMIGG